MTRVDSIPRIIHRIWLNGSEPEWTLPFADTWRQPGWVVMQWDEEALRKTLFPLQNQSVYDNAELTTPGSEGQLRGDVVRYELLYRYGGVYVDTDFECKRSIDPLLDGVDCFAAWEVQNRYVNNAIMGCIPGASFVQRCIAAIPWRIARYEGVRPNVLTGPHLVTEVHQHHPKELTVFDQKLFYPYAYHELHKHKETFDDAYAIHHWANQRRRRGVPLKPPGAYSA